MVSAGTLIWISLRPLLRLVMCVSCGYAITKIISESKTKIWIAGRLPHVLPTFTVGGCALKCVSRHKYVGITLSSTDRAIFKEHYYIKSSKARKSMNAPFGAENFVGTIPPQGGLSIYMASVDPHLMSACDVSVDIDPTLLTQLESVQKSFLRRLLGVTKRSPVATLFSETGMWPIKYRRMMLALRYWQYALSLPDEHFLTHSFAESLALARVKKSSWIADLCRVLATLHHPVHINLSRSWSPADIDGIITAVEQSCLIDIQTFLATSAKTPLLRHRSDTTIGHTPLQKSALCSFRPYLNIPIPAHRKAVVQLLTSSHTLAVEVLRWSERRRPPLPRSQRLCRYCHVEVEDEVHVLWCCEASSKLSMLRREFVHKLSISAPQTFLSCLRSASSLCHVVQLFSESVDANILGSFAKYVFDVGRVFKEVPVYRI